MAQQHAAWTLDAGQRPVRHRLRKSVACDVAVVGAGITGLVTAYLLARDGKSVVVVDQAELGTGESGRTTAHLTHVIDAWLPDLIQRLGRGGAKDVWDGACFAIGLLERIVRDEAIACDFQRVNNHIFTFDQPDRLMQLQRAADEIGYRSHIGAPAGLPFKPLLSLSFPNQARIQPQRFIFGLAEVLARRGVAVYDHARVVSVNTSAGDGGTLNLDLEAGGEIVAKDVVIAAHVPFVNRVLVHTKQASYRSYAVAISVPKGAFPDVLMSDTMSPYHYVRVQPRETDDLLIVGGCDHKTGQERDHEGVIRFRMLLDFARNTLQVDGPLVAHWSGQIIETTDGLPYVGLNANARHEWIATGFGGDGMSLGTLAAHVLSSRILGDTTAWDEIFAPNRLPVSKLKKYFAGNKDFPVHFLKDRLERSGHIGPEVLQPGDGGVFKVGDRRLAVSRTETGQLIALSPACTHLGCYVHWNEAELSWDCPCHGSRFAPDGEVLNGPACHGLARQELVTQPVKVPVVVNPIGVESAPT